MVLLSYNDDNHDTQYWFEGEYLGTEPMQVMRTMFFIGMEEKDIDTEIKIQEIYILDLKEDEVDIIHNLLSKEKNITKPVWQALIAQDYKSIPTLEKYL